MLKLTFERVGAIPPPPVPALNPRVEVWRDNEGLISAYGEVLDDEYRMHLPGLATFSFSHHGEEVAARITNDAREEVVNDAYLRKVLPMVLQVRGWEVLHASAVRLSAGVVALCGRSGTGKSTIAYGLNRRGHSMWADDTLAFEMTESDVVTLGLPFSSRLRSTSAQHFESEPGDRTGVLQRSQAGEQAPLSAVCQLRRTVAGSAPVSLRRLSSSDALVAVLAHAWSFALNDADNRHRMMRNYLDLVARVPIFEVSFIPDLANVPAILDAIEKVGDTT
jgi:hypothetical protein